MGRSCTKKLIAVGIGLLVLIMGLTEAYAVSPEMVFVQGGTFIMGDNGGEETAKAYSNNVANFYIGRFEVTLEEYRAFCRDTRRPEPLGTWGRMKNPAGVTWYDAVEYCNWLSLKDGLQPAYSGSNGNTYCDFMANGYRLPRESEWEFAAKGGVMSKGYQYSGSNNPDEVGWYFKVTSSYYGFHDVGRLRPNELGIYDMSGNAAEWCWDLKGLQRVVRGGHCLQDASFMRTAAAQAAAPNVYNKWYGFRLVRAAGINISE